MSHNSKSIKGLTELISNEEKHSVSFAFRRKKNLHPFVFTHKWLGSLSLIFLPYPHGWGQTEHNQGSAEFSSWRNAQSVKRWSVRIRLSRFRAFKFKKKKNYKVKYNDINFPPSSTLSHVCCHSGLLTGDLQLTWGPQIQAWPHV